MGVKRRDWDKVGEYVTQMKSEGLSYAEGAKRFGMKVSVIYEYNKRIKRNKSVVSKPIASPFPEECDSSRIGDYVRKIRELGMNMVDGAAHFDIPVSSIYKYNSRIKKKRRAESGLDGVFVKEKEPSIPASVDEALAPAIPSSLPEADSSESKCDRPVGLPDGVIELILNYRHAHPDAGYQRIADYLKNRYFVVVQRKKIRELLKFHGLSGTVDSSFDKPPDVKNVKGSRRFEASYPRELYQMDITYVYLSKESVGYLVVIMDDNSRFCVSAELRRDYRGLSMIEVLHRGIERYGKPSKVLTDQGSSFYTWSYEPTLFSRYLDDMKIEHIVSEPHSPQTLGKVERFNQTIQRELLSKCHFSGFEEACTRIESYVRKYNYERPHQGIGGAVPASRFHGVIGETSRIESVLCDSGIDFSRGYLVFKMFEHTISIVCNGAGLQVFLDGNLLERGGKGNSNSNVTNKKEQRQRRRR